MPSDTYTTYEAKTRFSEVMRRVRHGQRLTISYHGKQVAEIRPLSPTDESVAERWRRLEEEGVLQAPVAGSRRRWKPVARQPGALQRFLADRD